MNRERSQALLERAQKVLPGGVNSPVRAYRSVGGTPPFLVRGAGSHVWDADGNEYIDFIGSWGAAHFGTQRPACAESSADHDGKRAVLWCTYTD